MDFTMISLGGSNFFNLRDVSSIVEIGSMVSKSYIRKVTDDALLVDLAGGANAKTAIIMKSGYVILSDISTKTIRNRIYNAISQNKPISANEDDGV